MIESLEVLEDVSHMRKEKFSYENTNLILSRGCPI